MSHPRPRTEGAAGRGRGVPGGSTGRGAALGRGRALCVPLATFVGRGGANGVDGFREPVAFANGNLTGRTNDFIISLHVHAHEIIRFHGAVGRFMGEDAITVGAAQPASGDGLGAEG